MAAFGSRMEIYMKDYLHRNQAVRFLFPIDGDCVNKYDGRIHDGTLYIDVKIVGDEGLSLTVNDEYPLRYEDGIYKAELPILAYRTNLVLSDTESGEVYDKVVVLKLSNPTEGVRFSVDDNILFLKDINDNRDKYSSIFDNEYLSVYKEAHDRYGTKFQLNIHYETDYYKGFSAHSGDFSLDMMTDKFKEEWQKNSDWLRLSMHSRTVMPDEPYKTTDMRRISDDAKAIYRETERFAGAETLCRENTTIHWGECTLGGMRALKNLGLKGAYGYFDLQDNGVPLVSYFYPAELVRHIHERDFWYDTEEDLLFGKIDLVLNLYPHSEIIPRLREICKNPHIAGFLELMIHEEYFYPDYAAHIKEFREMVLDACRFAKEHGYTPRYMDEIV